MNSAQPKDTLLQGLDPMHIGGGSISTSPKNLEGTDPTMDLEAAMITSSANVEDRKREENGRPRVRADTYKAAKSNNVDYFQCLQESDVDDVLASITLSGKTVAHVAAIFNNKEVMEEVCTQKEALLTTADFMGATPLHEAAAHGHAEVVEVIIRCARAKSKLEEMLHMRTPGTAMDLAVENNHLKVVKVLADVEPGLLCPNLLWPYEGNRKSALDQASVRGYWDVVEFILADRMPLAPDRLQISGGDTPLHRAIAQKRTDIADILISRLPGIASRVDNEGNTPLHLACRHGLLETVQLLLQVNGDAVYRENNVNGRLPNHEAAIEGRIEVYRELVESFPDTEDLMDSNGENAFHMAIKANKFNMVQHILETTKNNNLLLAPVKGSGSTALHIAAEKELMWIVFLLLDDERTVSQRTLYDKNLQMPADIAQSKAENWSSLNFFSHEVEILWALTETGKYSVSDRIEFLTKRLRSPGARKKLKTMWKSTTSSLLLVNSIISTVSIAAIFTLPGGYEETSCLARCRSEPLLLWFVIVDTSAMFFAMLSAAIIIMANWEDFRGLPYSNFFCAVGTTYLSFCFLCLAFFVSLVLTVELYMAMPMVIVLIEVIGLPILILTMSCAWRSIEYACWRGYVLFRRIVKRPLSRAAQLLI